ncbi:cryptochrome/photolyase family protein [Silicimonas algicola]|uniref:Deoxyribodipyrimidine photolyase-related protein n=1 Tax=Silicimonas algicola TaxID=1826607 RepID=A0A316GBM1_9RHOB|nr:cryptochrome/photolyase family protein [Silicimonas algicola]AZQ66079.1 cryptochrome/photolyase family protein [Silicimonas algicola]PWK58379.1 deoxyribodipyrimidine photolyase-related protein [Silicimonas algicola]
MPRLVLVLGDQLTTRVAALREADLSTDVVVMAEVMGEATYVRHHVRKLAFCFSAMRHFRNRLRSAGWTVDYTQLDDEAAHDSIAGAILSAADRHGSTEVIATEPGEWRLLEALQSLPLKTTMLEDDRFVASHADFNAWAANRKELRMEWFYRDMRRKTGLLMEDGEPAGGQWNFDHDNRKPAPKGIDFGGPLRFSPDGITKEVLTMIELRFPDNFGVLRPFWFAVREEEAGRALSHFIKHALAPFGDYQDAMLSNDDFLSHSLLSIYLNAGLLDPIEVCEAAEQAWKDGAAPLNAVEGFIRQIIGWREYMRGIYWREGPEYDARNALSHRRKLPEFYWTAETEMRCIRRAVEATRDHAYAHHIQRLMVTGNFALLAGIDPAEVYDWYMLAYADAYGWVMAGNVIGMSQFADGGIVGSKPYVSSGNYINRMSDYCAECAYDVKKRTGEDACPFNFLYWHFLDRHRERFQSNPRMANMYRSWDRLADDKKAAVIGQANAFLDAL